MKSHSRAAVEHLRNELLDILAHDHPDGAEASWRMTVILHWWLDQMLAATEGDVNTVVNVLLQGLNDIGLPTEAVVIDRAATVQ